MLFRLNVYIWSKKHCSCTMMMHLHTYLGLLLQKSMTYAFASASTCTVFGFHCLFPLPEFREMFRWTKIHFKWWDYKSKATAYFADLDRLHYTKGVKKLKNRWSKSNAHKYCSVNKMLWYFHENPKNGSRKRIFKGNCDKKKISKADWE